MGDAGAGDSVGVVWRLSGGVGTGDPAAALTSTACSAPESEEEGEGLGRRRRLGLGIVLNYEQKRFCDQSKFTPPLRSSFTRKDKLQGPCFQLGRPGRRAAGGQRRAAPDAPPPHHISHRKIRPTRDQLTRWRRGGCSGLTSCNRNSVVMSVFLS